MPQPKLHILPPNPKLHALQLADFLQKSFGTYFDRAAITPNMLKDGFYSFQHSRIGILNHKIITHFGVNEYQMRVGNAQLRTAGIGGVSTHPAHRKKGYMDQTANACLQHLRNAGFDFTVLFGIPNFYHKFGYTRAWSEAEHIISLANLPEPLPEKSLTQFTLARTPELENLFNNYHATHTGTAVRPTFRQWNLRKATRLAYHWPPPSPNKKIAGYLALEDKGNHLNIIEAVGDSETILRAAARIAQKLACDQIHFICLHQNSPLAKLLRKGNLTQTTHHEKNRGALARLLNLQSTLQKLAPEFTHRLKSAGLHHYTGALTITTPTDSATLTIENAATKPTTAKPKPTATLTTGPEISQLILGTADPLELADSHNMRLTADAPFLLRALFPPQHPMLPLADHY